MALDLDSCYEFGGFVLIPKDKVLLHLDKQVVLDGKALELLTYLVSRPNTLIQKNELLDAVWGPDAKLKSGNITHHVTKIRRALGCDPLHPRFIKTIHGKEGYRFIASVKQVNINPAMVDVIAKNSAAKTPESTFKIVTHLFVPMYLGSDIYADMNVRENEGRWMTYKEIVFESARVCLSPSGFAVWHISETLAFAHLFELTEWRDEIYKKILERKHVISSRTKELISRREGRAELKNLIGVPGYVFSAFALKATTTRSSIAIRNVLKLLSTPSTFTSADKHQRDEPMLRRERQLIELLPESSEMHEFGVPGVDVGFATWDAVSYLGRTSDGSIEEKLVEFEIAVQALWWMSKCMTETFFAGDRNQIETVRMLIPDLKLQFSKIKNITATESPPLRTMVEAVVQTSRLKHIVDEVIEIDRDSR
jgi:DNA-binding winged helix-turn-helix (wHTH) protein